MRIVLLRAQVQSAVTAEQLNKIGHLVSIAPLSQLNQLAWQPPTPTRAVWLATSANAFLYAGAALEELARKAPPIALYVVGEKTARVRPDFLIEVDFFAKNVRQLCSHLASLHDQTSPVFYWTGRYRKPDMERFLMLQKRPTTIIETYSAESVTRLPIGLRQILQQGEADAVLHYSARQAKVFTDLCLNQDLQHQAALLTHFCLSHEIAEALKPLKARKCKVAAAPTQSALLQLLPPPDQY